MCARVGKLLTGLVFDGGITLLFRTDLHCYGLIIFSKLCARFLLEDSSPVLDRDRTDLEFLALLLVDRLKET